MDYVGPFFINLIKGGPNMAIATQEKVTMTDFNKNDVIKFAVENLKRRDPAGTYKKEEVEQQINELIESLMDKTGGMTAKEIGGKLANIFGKVPLHFSFDGHRPFTQGEKQKHNLMGHSDKELRKALNKIRGQEHKKAKAEWDVARRGEISLFRQYFALYLQETRGDHLKNEMGVIVGIGQDISYEKGHYKKIF